jgi:hypothetical protein
VPCGIGGDDGLALLALAAVREVGPHEHEAGELALRPGGRLQRDRVEAADLGEDLLQAPHELECALRAVLLLERMEVAEAGQRHHALVHARVVLHRAGAERVEAGVDAERAVGEGCEMADDLGLGQLGEARRLPAAKLVRDLGRREVVARERSCPAALLRLLEDELHAASTAASLSMSSGVRFSVTHTSRASSSPE